MALQMGPVLCFIVTMLTLQKRRVIMSQFPMSRQLTVSLTFEVALTAGKTFQLGMLNGMTFKITEKITFEITILFTARIFRKWVQGMNLHVFVQSNSC